MMIWYDIVNCNWLTPGGSSTVHIYTQNKIKKKTIHKAEHT